jgi:hypothetical protein
MSKAKVPDHPRSRPAPTAREAKGHRPAAKPLVVFLPDLFGSHLRDEQGRVWLDDAALELGGLLRLRIDAPGVTPDGVISATYRTIVEALEKNYEVNAFDYDWRQPLAVTVAAVRDIVAAPLRHRPVHLVGHGWGGLIAAAVAGEPSVAEALRRHDSRVVTFGAPFGGSREIRRMLDGAHPLGRMLAVLSTPRTTVTEVTGVFGGWPALHECASGNFSLAEELLPVLTTVAGTGVPTCVNIAASHGAAAQSEYLFHADGDGIVAATDAVVKGARALVIDGSHAQLVSSAEAIRVCLEQLAPEPPTTLTPTLRPSSQQLEGSDAALPDVITSVELIEAVTGRAQVTLVRPLAVSVLHSHLRQAEYPVAIGHYREDTIVSAESALDVALGGRLRRRFDLDMYPGEIGTVEVVHVPGAHPPGAIVIGLGEIGDLTPHKLTRVMTNACVRHAARIEEMSGGANGEVAAAASTVLIGANSGTLSVAESIRSIVRGVLEANRRLRTPGVRHQIRIERLQFVELFEDVAEQAAHFVRLLPLTLAQELLRGEAIRPASELAVYPGGEYSRPPQDRSSGWWQRVQISGPASIPGAPHAGRSDAIELAFTSLTNRAKLSQSTTIQSQSQVARLIEAAMLESSADLKLSRTLFEMLLPSSLKDSLRDGGNLLLLLNRTAARYPYELMADRHGTGEAIPLIEKCGLLRQIELPEIVAKTEITSGRDVLVIGPPLVPGWPSLTGARTEARKVADLARHLGFTPTLLVSATSRAVQTEIISSDARVLHIAAHGQYSDNPFESGVVIGDGEYLTTAHVAAMRRVPEFVFLNCCHLGRLGATAATAFPALAASLAEGLMNAGVRAVIAAGWTVDDDAAMAFAEAFYGKFLRGEPFGDAVRAARQKVLADYRHTNTWGAFQCYGSPDYWLRREGELVQITSDPVSRGELIARLRSLADRASGAQPPDVAQLLTEFRNYKQLITTTERWRDGQTLAELATVAAQLGEFAEAIDLYRGALGGARALAPLQVVEQLANMLARLAPGLASGRQGHVAADALTLFQEALSWLDWLDAKLPLTGERLALRGSVHKRWAMLTRRAARVDHLRRAWQAYGSARQLAGNESYQALVWLALGFLLKNEPREQLAAHAQEQVRIAQQRTAQSLNRSFWDRVAVPDALLHLALFQGTLTRSAVFDEIEAAYDNALATGPSARERASVRDHLVFLAEMLPDASLKLKLEPVPASELKRLIEQLH